MRESGLCKRSSFGISDFISFSFALRYLLQQTTSSNALKAAALSSHITSTSFLSDSTRIHYPKGLVTFASSSHGSWPCARARTRALVGKAYFRPTLGPTALVASSVESVIILGTAGCLIFLYKVTQVSIPGPDTATPSRMDTDMSNDAQGPPFSDHKVLVARLTR